LTWWSSQGSYRWWNTMRLVKFYNHFYFICQNCRPKRLLLVIFTTFREKNLLLVFQCP